MEFRLSKVGSNAALKASAPLRMAEPALSLQGQKRDGGTAGRPAPRGSERVAVPVLGGQVPGATVRKMVTILFTDIVDSSRLSLTLDPEALESLLALYFGEMGALVWRHGGIIEGYIGDEIMAVFGVPTLHEDDALRAVRTAIEMRETLAVLNHELEARWNVRLDHRIGINTGEVITGDRTQGARFVTGEAVRLAKRLEEAAAPNEILIGEATFRLVRYAVLIEPSVQRALKHGETIEARVVRDIVSDAPGFTPRFDAPLVGRARQRATLDRTFAKVVATRDPHLLTLSGDAGVGKSRLVSDFTADLSGRARVVHGRCLPYGEGITYWPIADIVRDVARGQGLEPGRASIAAALGDDDKAVLIADRVAEALGFGGEAGSSEGTFWAVRRFLEALTRDGPAVVVLDDLHWAKPTFLDLVEHVADYARQCPLLILCIARPELAELRPGWGAGRANATSIALEPLSDGQCREMITNLLGGTAAPSALETRIASAAEGNPLFAEELVAMLVDEDFVSRDDDRWTARSDLTDLPVPATIHALLAARLEGLPGFERAILTTAAVEGSVFHRDAVAALVRPSREEVLIDGLASLVRRDLIRPDEPDIAGNEAYRFRHVLIRDAAYRSLSKYARAELHERFADWLLARAEKRLREFEEIVGYHLEQAFRYRVALGSRDSRAQRLAERAVARLEAAGRRALARSDVSAAVSLLRRACELLATEDVHRPTLLAELGAALIDCGRLTEAGDVLDEARQHAMAARDERVASHVLVQEHLLRLLHVDDEVMDEAARATSLVIPVFQRCGDELGLCRARRLEALLHWNEARAEAAAEAWGRAAGHARAAGDRHAHNDILTWIASSLWFGPTPAGEGIRQCERLRQEVRDSPESEAAILRHLGGLHAMVGEFDVARQMLSASNAVYADLGLTLNAATSQNEAIVELLAGDAAAAEASLRKGYRALEDMGERWFLSTTAAFLARAILEQGRDEEAEELATLSASLAAKRDLLSQILWRGVRARVLARRARFADAEALAREAVAIAENTDFLNHRADALVDLAEVHRTSGDVGTATIVARQAMDLYDRKGNSVLSNKIGLNLAKLAKL